MDTNCFSRDDLNIHLLDFDVSKYSWDFVNSVNSFASFRGITKPTRITKTSATLADNALCIEIRNISHSGIICDDTSDHLPVF